MQNLRLQENFLLVNRDILYTPWQVGHMQLEMEKYFHASLMLIEMHGIGLNMLMSKLENLMIWEQNYFSFIKVLYY